jgi:HSP20 family protein
MREETNMLQTWNPWQDLEDMRRRLNRTPRYEGSSSWAPATDIVEDADGLSLYLDLPDVDEGSLAVTSEQNNLSVKATRRYPKGEGQTVHYQGRPKGVFSMTFSVPSSFDLNKVVASYENGVLTLHVPRSESTRPRKIDVATGRSQAQSQDKDQDTQYA